MRLWALLLLWAPAARAQPPLVEQAPAAAPQSGAFSVLDLTKPGHVRRLDPEPGATRFLATKTVDPKPDIQEAPVAAQGTPPVSSPGRAPTRAAPNPEGVSLRPGYHILSPNSWVNDPNGLMQYKGVYHIFYQVNPADSVWGSPSWGHVASTDLAHWKRLPDALVPGEDYDADGCFSGSATIAGDGTPLLFYTGASRFRELGYYRQQQALAVPANASDPELAAWAKLEGNPVLAAPPPGVAPAEFRDPTTAWQAKSGIWHSAIGVQDECIGGAVLYSSPDLRNWTYAGRLSSQVGVGLSNGTCELRREASPGLGRCDQFGEGCRAWECPDYFQVGGGLAALKYSDQVAARQPYAADWYVLGTLPDLSDERAVLGLQEPTGAFTPRLPNGTAGPFTPQLWDFGAVYASKSFRAADGRLLWSSWVYETAAGCFQQCSTGTALTAGWGYQGALTLPRVITYDPATHALLANPPAELEALRGRQLYAAEGLALTPAAPVVLLPGGAQRGPSSNSSAARPSESLGRQLELVARFSLPGDPPGAAQGAAPSNGSGPAGEAAFSCTVELSTGSADQRTSIELWGRLALRGGGNATLLEARVLVNKTRSGGATNTSVSDGGPIPLLGQGLPLGGLDLRVFVDHSLLEVFVLGGRGRVASRIYPQEVDFSWGMAVQEEAAMLPGPAGAPVPLKMTAHLWELGSAWVDALAKPSPASGARDPSSPPGNAAAPAPAAQAVAAAGGPQPARRAYAPS